MRGHPETGGGAQGRADIAGDIRLKQGDACDAAISSISPPCPFAGVGAVAIVLPLVNQMNPSADVLALSTTEIDLSKIQPGQAIKTSFRKQPLFVRNLTPKEIAEAKAVPSTATLRDPADARRTDQAGQGKLADHAGRLHPSGLRAAWRGRGREQGPFGGYFCPCHGSAYDTAARIRKGPAPRIWSCRLMNSTPTPS
jgi:ubiquinol-cytochrome c reductase iron-sulfur subunit